MLKSLDIKNFKSHVDTDIELFALNLFTGQNSTGKSAAIEALLLAMQTSDYEQVFDQTGYRIEPIVAKGVSIACHFADTTVYLIVDGGYFSVNTVNYSHDVVMDFKEEKVLDDFLKYHPGIGAAIRDHKNAWLGRILDCSVADVKEEEDLGFAAQIISPLLLTILSSKVGDLVILKHPEVHLHPSSQARLMKLIIAATQAGIQFIIETHSDHIVNNVLIAIKEYEMTPSGGIGSDKIGLYHFSIDDGASRVERVKIGSGGRIKNAPNNFFDQLSNDRRYLRGF